MRAATLPGFDKATRPDRWEGERLPVLYRGLVQCGHCGFGHLTMLIPYIEDSLFVHGGYGESVRRTVGVCGSCSRVTLIQRESVRPPLR